MYIAKRYRALLGGKTIIDQLEPNIKGVTKSNTYFQRTSTNLCNIHSNSKQGGYLFFFLLLSLVHVEHLFLLIQLL